MVLRALVIISTLAWAALSTPASAQPLVFSINATSCHANPRDEAAITINPALQLGEVALNDGETWAEMYCPIPNIPPGASVNQLELVALDGDGLGSDAEVSASLWQVQDVGGWAAPSIATAVSANPSFAITTDGFVHVFDLENSSYVVRIVMRRGIGSDLSVPLRVRTVRLVSTTGQ